MASPPSAPTNGARRWCFTWNNPGPDHEKWKELPDGVRFLIWQAEIGERGTLHLQGYVEFTLTVRMTGVKQRLGSEEIHVEQCRGSAADNILYCTKEEGRISGPWRLGEQAHNDGKSHLQDRLEEAVATIANKRSIAEVDPTILMRYPAGCARVLSIQTPKMRPDLVVICIVGETGIGKTWSAHDLVSPECLYTVNYGNGGLWWDGYIGQKAVIFDEFKGQVPMQRMLQLLDVYDTRLEIKGGFTPAEYQLVFITSNSFPEDWYQNVPGYDRTRERAALLRRLGVIITTHHTDIKKAQEEIYEQVRARLGAYMSILMDHGIVLGRGFASRNAPQPFLEICDLPRCPTAPITDDDDMPYASAAQAIVLEDEEAYYADNEKPILW